MKKKVLSLFLALGLCLGLLPTAAMAAEYTVTEVVPCKYDSVGNFSEGLAAVNLDGKWGFIDKTGKEVIPCKYEHASGFSEGLAAVELDNKWGFIDKTDKEVIPCKYNDAEDFSEGLAAVKNRQQQWGFIDQTGTEVIPCKYIEAKNFSEGLAAVKLGEKWGFIDQTGTEVILCKYVKVGNFSEGLAVVADENSMCGFLDTTGKEVVPCTLPYVSFMSFPFGSFSEGLLAVRKGNLYTNLWGFVDKTGQEVIPFQYWGNGSDGSPIFSEGLAAVILVNDIKKGPGVVDYYGDEGVIDTTGQEVVPFGKYDAINNFSAGLAAVCLDGKWGFIDKTGQEVVPCTLSYSSVQPLSDGFAKVSLPIGENDWAGRPTYKWGVISVSGAAGETPAPAPTATTAYASTQTVMVDNKPVEFNAYALKDANGNMTNYVKLRDVASVLNGSAAQFQVGWDGSISITTKQAYTANGSEMVKNFSGDQQYTVNTSSVKVNGKTADMEAITLTDSTGGYTYFKLRDLGRMLGFNVSWIDGKIVIDPNSPYSDAN